MAMLVYRRVGFPLNHDCDIVILREIPPRWSFFQSIEIFQWKYGRIYKTFEPRKKPSYFPLYWLVNRDPYNGLL